MQMLWRISNHPDLSGEGARKASGRWNTRGNLVVYLADSPASALLEQIVHLQDGNGKLPRTYDLLRVALPDTVEIRELLPLASTGWKEDIDSTQRTGDTWLTSRKNPLARIPSALVPYTWNYLLNPLHPDASRLTIEDIIRERFDPRLFQFGAR